MAKLQVTVNAPEALDVRTCVLVERVSGPFSIDVWARSRDASIDLDAIVGFPATVRLDSGHVASPLGGVRELVGRVELMRLVEAEPAGVSTYHLRIVPHLSTLALRQNHRLFLDSNIPAAVELLLKEWNIRFEWQLDVAAYPVLGLRTQYGESDFAFLSRLLQEAGIAYMFRHDGAETKLILSDGFSAAAPRPGPIPFIASPNPKETREYVTAMRIGRTHRPHALTRSDYDFTRPSLRLEKTHARGDRPKELERFHYDPHSALAQGSADGATPVADDRGAYRHLESHLAQVAERGLDALQFDDNELLFELATIDLAPGMTFKVSDHPELSSEPLLMCTEMTIEASSTGPWTSTVRAVHTDRPWRPARSIERPRAQGFVSATVVGPEKNEIHVDEHGRIRIQFPWDRRGLSNEKSSMWVRISNGWAGAGFGMQFLPRVGQEVLIAFLGANPDAPVVLGRAYNRGQPVPYKLPPAGDINAIRSASSPAAGWNEVVFEDKAGAELVFLQAERRRSLFVKNDEQLTTVGQRTQEVETMESDVTLVDLTQETRGNRIELTTGRRTEETVECDLRSIGGDQFERMEVDRISTIEKDRHETVAGSRFELLGLDENVHYLKSRIDTFGSWSRSVGGAISIGTGDYLVTAGSAHVTVADDAVFDAPDITLKAGGSFIRIDAAGVVIRGPVVKINAGGGAGSGAGVGITKPELPQEALVDPGQKPARVPAGGFGTQTPEGPEPPVTVRIFGATITQRACPLLPKGKRHVFTAVGTPDGGRYRWVAKGGVKIVGAADSDTVTLEGSAVSAKLEAADVEVEYTLPEGVAKDVRKITVFEIEKIEARLRATPCLRTKRRADIMPPKSSSKDDKVINASATTVVRGSGELKLKAIVHPAKVPITWQVERAADDLPSLSGVPSHAQSPDGPDARILRLDATGSFHVHGFVDCDGDGKRGPDEVGKILNVNIVEVSVLPGLRNNRQSITPLFSDTGTNAAFLVVRSSIGGGLPASPYGDGELARFTQGAKLGVLLLGGGANGRRGVSEIGMGFVHIGMGETIRGNYADGKVVRSILAADPATPDPVLAGPVPELSYPIRDHAGNDHAGYGVFINGSDDKDRASVAEGGQKRVVRMLDGPSIVFNKAHPGTGAALSGIAGAINFKINATIFSIDYPENFTTLGTATWRITFGSYTAAGGWTNVGARVTGDRRMRVHHPVEQSERTPSFERCPPGYTDRLRLDAR